jgi:ATP-dependent DNA helicase RecG
MDLEALLRGHEGKRLEFKRDLSSPGPVMKSLVAFANTAGGVLLIGVEDRTRTVLGVDQPLDVEERLMNLVSDRISPRLVPEVEVVPWRSTHVVAVEVHLSPNRPHHVNADGPEQGTYVRLGSTNRRADAPLIAEMARSARYQSFDETPMVDLDEQGLDFDAATSAFAPVRRLRRRDLESLGCLTEAQGRLVPTIGGMLLFGKDRPRWFPDAWMQVARFDGTDRARIVDQIEVNGPLPGWIDDAFDFVDRHLARGVDIAGPRRSERRALPMEAVREAIVNSVIHADYSQPGGPIRVALYDDRIEVENPGLLPFGLTVEEMRTGVSRVRNRMMARVLRELGYVEQWGSGVGRMDRACLEAGLEPPIFEELGGRFRVTLASRPRGEIAIDETDQAILAAITTRGATTSDVATEIAKSTRTARARLQKLVDRGIIVEIGSGPNDPRRRYYRSTP